MSKVNRVKYFKYFVTVVCLGVFTLSLASCTAVKRKFTRKKKEKKVEEFIPVLEPVDYASMAKSPAQRYEFYYLLWKSWQKDFVQGIQFGEGNKRLTYILTQLVTQLEQMQKFLNEENSDAFNSVIADYKDIYKTLDKPQITQNSYLIIREMERNSRKLRERFSPLVLKAEDYTGAL